MDFLNHLQEYIDINKYYDKLSELDNNDYKNIINYLNIQWSKILLNIDDKYYSNIKINKVTKCDLDLFNIKMNEFINNNYTLGMVFVNTLIRYI